MPQLRDHNRNTRAANADLLGDEASLKKPAPLSTPQARPAGEPEAENTNAGKPGKDINQAGFLKDEAQGRP